MIAGMSGKLPESENLQEFWANLIGGVDMVTDDDRRWKAGECPLGIRQQDSLRVCDQGTSGDGEHPVELAVRLRTSRNEKGQVVWWVLQWRTPKVGHRRGLALWIAHLQP